ncbi:MAG: sulfite exporter TauE/SafE family protein [Planctomycetota bacterium]|nr:MAG: sulfite exporter TauE/SafE family protein [Planctomycetota bacterium]
MFYTIVGASLIGLSLGLLGAGGSILTVPVLTYVLGHDSKAAIAESLAIVGGIAASGAMLYAKSGLVDWRSVVFFGLPGMAGTYLGAWSAKYVSGGVQLSLFAVVMLAAAWMMASPPRWLSEDDEHVDSQSPSDGRKSIWTVAPQGMAVGVLTGLVGVGGGFLIVPALVLLAGLSMRVAVGTSLVVIALNAGTGFIKYFDVLQHTGQAIDWRAVGIFLAIGIAGSVVGKRIGTRVDQQTLRKAFAVFLLAMGVFVLSREAPVVWHEWQATKSGVWTSEEWGEEAAMVPRPPAFRGALAFNFQGE